MNIRTMNWNMKPYDPYTGSLLMWYDISALLNGILLVFSSLFYGETIFTLPCSIFAIVFIAVRTLPLIIKNIWHL